MTILGSVPALAVFLLALLFALLSRFQKAAFLMGFLSLLSAVAAMVFILVQNGSLPEALGCLLLPLSLCMAKEKDA